MFTWYMVGTYDYIIQKYTHTYLHTYTLHAYIGTHTLHICIYMKKKSDTKNIIHMLYYLQSLYVYNDITIVYTHRTVFRRESYWARNKDVFADTHTQPPVQTCRAIYRISIDIRDVLRWVTWKFLLCQFRNTHKCRLKVSWKYY